MIGEVLAEPAGIVSMVTGFGGTRIVDMLAGEQLPRINSLEIYDFGRVDRCTQIESI